MKKLITLFVKIWDKFDRFLCHALMPTRLRLWWRRQPWRKDEFHPCYSLDLNAMLKMDKQEELVYRYEIIERRNRAHNRDLLIQ